MLRIWGVRDPVVRRGWAQGEWITGEPHLYLNFRRSLSGAFGVFGARGSNTAICCTGATWRFKTALFAAPEPLGAQNGCSGMPLKPLGAQNGCSGMPSKLLGAQKHCSGMPLKPLGAQNYSAKSRGSASLYSNALHCCSTSLRAWICTGSH